MFNEGSKIIFRVALTLIKMNETELLRCSDFGDMAELFKQITRSSSVLDCHQFIEVRTLYLITNQSPTGNLILFSFIRPCLSFQVLFLLQKLIVFEPAFVK